MGYHTEKLEMPVSPGLLQEFTYALLYRISSVELVKIENLHEIDWSECQEARFFSEEKELHVFEAQDGKEAVLVSDEGTEERIVKRYELASRFMGIGRVLKVVEYPAYDEDGQMRVALTRLAGIE